MRPIPGIYMSFLIVIGGAVNGLFAQDIQLTNSRDKNTIGVPVTEYFFDATVHGVPTRKVQVHGYLQANSKGTVVLTSGGKGQSYYSSIYDEPSKDLIRSLHAYGLEVYEIKYTDPEGWSQHCEGLGYSGAVQIYTEMVRYLHANYFQNGDIVIATGNSGGSFQIGFGLTNFELDEIMDMVILTGGPPISDLKNGIFGDNTLDQWWPNGLVGGRALTDHVMGWTAEGYCANRSAPDSILNLVHAASLAAHDSTRVYSYSTLVNFVESEDPTNAHHQARIYYDSIKTEKAWYFLPDVDLHAVPKSIEGALKIEELILDFLAITSLDPKLDMNVKVYPNPASELISIDLPLQFEDIEIRISNISGEEIYRSKINGGVTQIPLHNFSGVLIVRLTDDDTASERVFTIVKQ